MKQIHQVEWKFGTQNLVATCILTLKKILEYFLKSILGNLYIFFRSFGSSKSNALNGVQIGAEMKKLWSFEDSYADFEEQFRNDFEIQFEITPILNSHTATLIFCLLYFGNRILSTSSLLSGPHTN